MTSPMIPPTRNPAWGFWGTISCIMSAAEMNVGEAWTFASATIATATGATPEGVRDYLDSRDGRHFADDIANELARGAALEDATEAAVARWMGWHVDRRTSRATGIPAGLPYLTGRVTHYEILVEIGPESG